MRYSKFLALSLAVFLYVGCADKVEQSSSLSSTNSGKSADQNNQNADQNKDGQKRDNFVDLSQDGNNDQNATDENANNGENATNDENAANDQNATNAENGSDENGANANANELEPVYFAFGKYEISDAMKPVIKSNAAYIKANLGKDLKKVLIAGNTDEFGSSEYNFALGLKRATVVRDALSLQGVSKKVLDYVSYGKTNPVCTEKTRDCYAKNRRTDLSAKDKDSNIKSGTKINKNAK